MRASFLAYADWGFYSPIVPAENGTNLHCIHLQLFRSLQRKERQSSWSFSTLSALNRHNLAILGRRTNPWLPFCLPIKHLSIKIMWLKTWMTSYYATENGSRLKQTWGGSVASWQAVSSLESLLKGYLRSIKIAHDGTMDKPFSAGVCDHNPS